MREHLKNYIENGETPEVRGLRILLEYFYATEVFEKIGNKDTLFISVFGSARSKPNTTEYHIAYEIGKQLYQSGFAVVTGASRGVMQAANQGVADAIAHELVKQKKAASLDRARSLPLYRERLKHHSVGLSISLPMESENNPYVGVSATFHYFMVRKFFFCALSSGFIACEGGWGTRDELYEMLTLVQTGKAPLLPIVYVSPDSRYLEMDIQHTLKKNYISEEDVSLIQFVKKPEQAVEVIRHFYRRVKGIHYDRQHTVSVEMRDSLPRTLREKVERLIEEGCVRRPVYEWKGKTLVLTNFTPASYGYLRRAVDVINDS